MRTPSPGTQPLPRLDGEPGPALERAPQALRAMRERVLERADAGGRRKRSHARMPLRIAAALGIALASTGTVLAAVRSWPVVRGYFAPDAAQQAAAPAAAQTRPRSSAAPSARTTALAPALPVVAPSAEASPPAATAPGRAGEPPAHRAPPRAPTDLLARANQLRAEQRWRAAEALYLRVLDERAGADARSAAALAAAELRLRQLHAPRGALALFQRALALAPASVLAEQARHGIAQSYRALGDRSRERAALEAFLAAHPQSAMRARAQARLRTLAGEAAQ